MLAVLADLERLSATKAIAAVQINRNVHPQQERDKVAKGQLRSNREKKKPKAERNKKKSAPAISPFTPTRLTGKSAAGRKFS